MPNDTQAKVHPVVEFRGFLDSNANALAAVLPQSITVERFKRIVLTAVQQDPKLLFADRRSLWNSCVKCANDGLLPDGREATLQVYSTKQKDGSYKELVQYMPMITGIYKRARNSGEIAILRAYVVHAKDKFKIVYGSESRVEHEPALADRGEPIGAYAVSELKDGSRDCEWMSVAEVEKIRAKSRSKDGPAWRDWWDEMARKCVVRRLAKRLPMDSGLASVIEGSTGEEREIAEPPKSLAFADEPPIEIEMPPIKEHASAAAAAADAHDAGAPLAVAPTGEKPPEPKAAPTQAQAPAADLSDAQVVVAEFSRQIDEATDKATLKLVWDEIERADLFPVDKDALKMRAQTKQAALNIARAGR